MRPVDFMVDAFKITFEEAEKVLVEEGEAVPKIILVAIDEESGVTRCLSQYEPQKTIEVFAEAIGQVMEDRKAGTN